MIAGAQYDPEALLERSRAARAMLHHCTLCELRCGTNRLAGQPGRCRLGPDSFLYKHYLSLNEEPELMPALRLFLGGCNFRCQYCDEAPLAFRPGAGRRIEAATWAAQWAEAAKVGARAISLLGGEPSLHAHTILQAAAASPRPLPLALNSNMYMTPAVLDLLAGVVDWYLADFKFGNDACAARFAGVQHYTAIVQRNIRAAAQQARVIVRHVLLPGHLECCFRPVVDWVVQHLPNVRFQLYPGYVPCDDATEHTLARLNTPEEVTSAQDYLKDRVVNCGSPSATTALRQRGAQRACAGIARITIGVDGCIYCHDLTPALASALATFCPADQPQDQT
ncbi:MAG: radical SAM protein [Planctomycetes bacterium]|nr:radical SAM protein [Planctomycetota bacterium]